MTDQQPTEPEVEPHEMPVDDTPPSDDLVANRGPDDEGVEL